MQYLTGTNSTIYKELSSYIQSNLMPAEDKKSDAIMSKFYSQYSTDRPIVTVNLNGTQTSLRIEDGDTFRQLDNNTDYRLLNVDTREVAHEGRNYVDIYGPWQGYCVYKILQEASKNGYKIETSLSGQDAFKRTLTDVFIVNPKDGTKIDLATLMVGNGISEAYRAATKQPSSTPYETIRSARDEAANKGLGIFGATQRANIALEDIKRQFLDKTYTFNTRYTQKDYDLNLEENKDRVKIGDVWLSIPPTHLTIAQLRTSQQVPLLNFEAKTIPCPASRIVIKTNLVFQGERINTDLKRILIQFKYCPFNIIHSRDLWEKLCGGAVDSDGDALGGSSFLWAYHDVYAVPVTMDSYTLYTIEGHPNLVGVAFQFTLFNFIPYFRYQDDKMEYYKYDKALYENKNNKYTKEFLAMKLMSPDRTTHLEKSIHPYNIMIEDEIKSERYHFDFDNSALVLTKISEDFALKALDNKRLDNDGVLKPEDVVDVVKELAIPVVANSISITYNNNFAWTPVIGYNHPAAQYLGPGEGYVHINVKTDDIKFINRITKTYHDLVEKNEYGYYDDRYLVESSLINLAEFKVLSIYNVGIRSIEGKPGWSDINIAFSKSTYEYTAKISSPVWEYDKYWGLQRVFSIEQDKTVADILKASNDATAKQGALFSIPGGNSVNISGMDETALKEIVKSLNSYYNSEKKTQDVLKNNFQISQAKLLPQDIASETDAVWVQYAVDAINEYESREGKAFPYYGSNANTYTTENNGQNIILYWDSIWNKIAPTYGTTDAKVLEGKKKRFKEVVTSSSYINADTIAAMQGKSLIFKCTNINEKTALINELKAAIIGDGNNNLAIAEKNNSVIVKYNKLTNTKANDAASLKATKEQEAKKEELMKALTKYSVAAKPFAGHRYFPNVDDFISTSLLLSNTVGGWFASRHLEDLPEFLQEIESSAVSFCQPTRNYKAWTEVYGEYSGVPEKLRESIKRNVPYSPTAVIDSVLAPVTANDTNSVISKDGMVKMFYEEKETTTQNGTTTTTGGAQDYPFNTWSDIVLMDTYIKDAGYTKIDDLKTAANTWINDNLATKTYGDNINVKPAAHSLDKHYNFNNKEYITQAAGGQALAGSLTMAAIVPSIYSDKSDKLRALSIKDEFPSRRGVHEAQRAIYDMNSSLRSYIANKDTPDTPASTEGTSSTPSIFSPEKIDIPTPLYNSFYYGNFANSAKKTYNTNSQSSKSLGPTYTDGSLVNPSEEVSGISDIITRDMILKLSKNSSGHSKKACENFLLGLQPTDGLENAFPTFKLYIVQEDTSEIKFFSLDDYYDFRMVQDLLVIRGKDQFVHMLKARVVVDPRYITTNPKIAQNIHAKSSTEFDTSVETSPDDLDTQRENYFNQNRMPLRVGLRVCLKLGYHSDPRAMDTVFMGTIVSLNGRQETGVYEIDAEGDGRELTVPATRTLETLTGNNFAEIITKILVSNINVTHFGKVYGTFLERISRRHHTLLRLAVNGLFPMDVIAREGLISTQTLLHGMGKMATYGVLVTNPALLAAGTVASAATGGIVAKTWGARSKLWEEEIKTPLGDWAHNREQIARGQYYALKDYFCGQVFSPEKASMQIGKIIEETSLANNNPVDDNIFAVDIWSAFSSRKFELNIDTRIRIWDVLKIVKCMYPNFALDVRPYGNRSTIFLGPIGYNYWRTDDPIQSMAPALMTLGGQNKLSEEQVEAIKTVAPKLDDKGRVKDAGLAPFIPFQKQHVVTSKNDIIVNGIKATPSRGWNTVVCAYGSKAESMDPSDLIEVAADIDLEPGAIKKQFISATWTDDKRLATLYALGVLKEGVEKLYGGTLIIRGNSKIEPCDKVYISDSINKMYGWIEVETVIHKFDSEMGFTTHIVPNMVCHINGDAYLTSGHIARSILLKKVTSKEFLWMLGSLGVSTVVGFATGGLGFIPSMILANAAGMAVGAIPAMMASKSEAKDEPTQESQTEIRPERETTNKLLEDTITYHAKATLSMIGACIGEFTHIYYREIKPEIKIVDKSAYYTERVANATKGRMDAIWTHMKGAVGKGDFSTVGKFTNAKHATQLFGRTIGNFITATGKSNRLSLLGGKATKLAKGGFSIAIAASLMELIPVAIETFLIKAATRNNAIVVSPIWQRNQLMMQGLEGYKNNTIWGHIQDQITAVNYAANQAAKYLEGTYGVVNDNRGDNIEFVSSTEAAKQANSGRRDTNAYDAIIKRAAMSTGLDAALIKAVIRQESNFNQNIVSPKGAKGLMQVMPDTARGLGIKNAADPEENIMKCSKYLKSCIVKFNGNLDRGLAGYNWGPNRKSIWTDGWMNIAETRNYVRCVKQYYNQYKGTI